ncbi:Protein required for attachment to host cells [Frateuria terrea]|uniref:Protein required for attachment to host cells n=2 Tax=Frateuria terrea TaxID=529704 RepID=A0A1H6V1I1_9GAMM|nr:Protein required for attachment to host cells [Frateuria terrea]SFP33999.1 Protein required for attachment to host cells [Frateuria terrea]
MNKTWVLVADSVKARLFEFERSNDPWAETACFINPYADTGPAPERPARVHESMGPARHAIEPHTRRKDASNARFASMLALTLRKAHEERRFETLVIAAAPRFLGALHGQMDKALQHCVSREIRRNLTGVDSAGIREYLLH